ncbi:hypothetical protein ACFYVL_32425 [Streptomyces sp. NPDC004111]|uniref:hypothetical protein n=1 Tax=Streptomyces sp. NPDC004111 TaxID=3364690 RepID=UPI0036985078
MTGYPSACARAYGRIELFSIGPDYLAVRKADPWSADPWEKLGAPGSLGIPPAVVSMRQENIEAFFHFGHRNTYNSLKATPWSGWYPFDCQSQWPIAVCSWGPNRMDLFKVGTGDGRALGHKWFENGVWSNGWENLGGQFGNGVAAASWAPGRIDVFGVGYGNRAIWHKWFDNGSWSNGWEDMQGITNDAPSVASWGPGRLDLFHTGLDRAVYHKWFAGGWSGWENMGGIAWSGTATAAPGPGRLALFHRGRENTIWVRKFGF